MQKTKVLYVEDEPFLAKIVKESLESRAFDVQMVEDGLLAQQEFVRYEPDICILDVMLPNKDGFTIGKEIRAIHPTIPIVFLTAKNQTSDLLEGFKSGGNDYIKKPFSMEELIIRIQNLLHLTATVSATTPSDAISIGSYIFYPLKYQLVKNEVIQKLSHRDTELLKIFTNNQDKAIHRKDILMKIWGDDSYFNSRNLDVYIKKLRDYFKEDTTVRIVTLKGVGYHFSVG